MKKIISALFLISAMAVISSAQIIPTDPNCTRGHINSPILVCEPPHRAADDGEIGIGGKKTSNDDSLLTMVKTFIAAHNPFVYFLT